MVNHLSKRIIEDQGRACEIKRVFAKPARPTETFDMRSRHAALRTEWRLESLHPVPAGWTYGTPSPFPDLGVAENTSERKKKVENCVDHRRLRDAKGRLTV